MLHTFILTITFALVLSSLVSTNNAQCNGGLAKYVDPLPLPPVLSLLNGGQVTIIMSKFTQKLHRDLPPTTLWGYQQSYPGPTIEVFSGKNVSITWVNKLTSPLVQIPNATATVVHLHGGHVPAESDGYPLHYWFPGDQRTYIYPNKQNASMLWYHDHTAMNTRVNVYLGLAGMYIVRDTDEMSLKLPSGKYEIPIMIQDKLLDMRTGQIQYPIDFPPDPQFHGDTIIANGKAWPFVEVEPTLYRLRLLNGANTRTFNLSLSNKAPFTVIGGDQGFLPKPVSTTWLLLMPAERADVIFDFSSSKNQKIVLINTAHVPDFPGGNPPDPCTDGIVLQFTVGSSTSCGKECRTKIPSVLRPWPHIDLSKVSIVRNITLDRINDGFALNKVPFEAPITEFPVLSQTEIWNFISSTDMAHPLHIHLSHFFVLQRQKINREKFDSTGLIEFIGAPEKPLPTELGPKDTVRVDPKSVTSVAVQFEDYTGLFVYHCHMLEHEDYMMMRPFKVLPK